MVILYTTINHNPYLTSILWPVIYILDPRPVPHGHTIHCSDKYSPSYRYSLASYLHPWPPSCTSWPYYTLFSQIFPILQIFSGQLSTSSTRVLYIRATLSSLSPMVVAGESGTLLVLLRYSTQVTTVFQVFSQESSTTALMEIMVGGLVI